MSEPDRRPFGWRTSKALSWALGDLTNDRDYFRVSVIVCAGGGAIGWLMFYVLPLWACGLVSVLVLLLWGWMIFVWHMQSRNQQHR